jgi:cobalt-zinc-cadmium efflux system membrane fusion protein
VTALAAATGMSCDLSHASSGAEGSHAPPGEVWLTPEQMTEGKIEVTTVAEQVVDDFILTSSTITLDDLRTGHVLSPVTGRVIKIMAQLGQRVKKGEPLATIESPDIGNAVSDTNKAEADLISAEHDFRRKKDLFEQKAASAADVEASEDNYRTAKAELERARQKQFLLRVGHVDAVVQSYTLTSPIDGEVLLRNVTPGMEVQGQYSGGTVQELFTIGDIDKVWVLGDVYEIEMARVHVGAAASVSVIAYPDKVFPGRVDWVSGGLDQNTRTAKVRCTFDNPEGLLRPLMYATMRIAVDSRKAIAVPRDAVLRLGEYEVSFVEIGDTDGRARFARVPVDVDETGGAWLKVVHGLDAGQKIVVHGTAYLSQRL